MVERTSGIKYICHAADHFSLLHYGWNTRIVYISRPVYEAKLDINIPNLKTACLLILPCH